MARIESYFEPRRLYRYRSLRKLDHELEAIREGYLYCAPFEDLNDPMEGLFASSRFLRNSENYREMRKAVTDKKTRIGICSFSEAHDHELMWAHYADQFRGICGAFNLARLKDCLDEDIRFVRMYYSEVVPTISLSDGDASPGRLAKRILSHKNHRWLYEREWRMFADLGKVFYRNVACVTHVYLGSRISDNARAEIKTLLRGLEIQFSDMTINKYQIQFD